MLSYPVSSLLRVIVIGGVLLAMSGAPAQAQEINWRTNYNAARKEAREKSRPIFLDIGTENCFHCRRLDASTFRDPAIVELLNTQFIPLKIDGNVETTLVEALRIQAYPTLVVAGSDGKILSMLEGYMEAGRLQTHLQRAMMQSTPDWMARDFQEATKSLSNAEYARAVSLLKGVLQDGKQRPVQLKAREVLYDIERQAAGRLARAREMDDRGQSVEAVDVLTDLLKRYAGTQAADEGARLMAGISNKPELRQRQRALRARELLAQAKEEFRDGEFLRALDHCELLKTSYGDLDEGQQGAELAQQIQSDPHRMQSVVQSMDERMAEMNMALADAWIKNGKPNEAKLALERVVKTCPRSHAAELAQARLTQLKNDSSARAVGFEKEE